MRPREQIEEQEDALRRYSGYGNVAVEAAIRVLRERMTVGQVDTSSRSRCSCRFVDEDQTDTEAEQWRRGAMAAASWLMGLTEVKPFDAI